MTERDPDPSEDNGDRGEVHQTEYPWRSVDGASNTRDESNEDSEPPSHTPNPSSPSREKNTGDQETVSQNNGVQGEGEVQLGDGNQSNRYGEEVIGEEGRCENGGGGSSSSPFYVRVLMLVVSAGRWLFHRKMLGFHWLVPRITGTTDKDEGLSGRFYPDRMVREDEKVVYAGHPSRWMYPGPYIGGAVFLSLAVAILLMVPLGMGQWLLDIVTPAVMDLEVPDRWWYAPILFGILGIGLLVRQALHRTSTWHIITEERLLYRTNVIATHKRRIDLFDVNRVDDHKPIPQRWYGIGNIDVYTASTKGIELEFEGVDNPTEVVNLIDRLTREKHEKVRQQHGGIDQRVEGQSQNRDRGGRNGQNPVRGEDTYQRKNPSENRRTDSNGGRRQNQRRDRGGQGSRSPVGERPPGEGGQVREDAVSGGTGLADDGDDSRDQHRPENTLRDDIADLSEKDRK